MKRMTRALRRYHQKRVKKKNLDRHNQGSWWIGGPDEAWKEATNYVPSWFKRMKGRARRAKEKQALREGKEVPKFKKSNIWEWW